MLATSPISPLIVVFIVAAVMRLAQGSATVAIITAAGIVRADRERDSRYRPDLIVLALLLRRLRIFACSAIPGFLAGESIFRHERRGHLEIMDRDESPVVVFWPLAIVLLMQAAVESVKLRTYVRGYNPMRERGDGFSCDRLSRRRITHGSSDCDLQCLAGGRITRAGQKPGPKVERFDFRPLMQQIWDGWGTLDPANTAKFYSKDAERTFFRPRAMKYTGWNEYQAGVKKAFAYYSSAKFSFTQEDMCAKGKLRLG